MSTLTYSPFARFLTVKPLSDPIEWIESHMSLRWDPTSASDGMVKLEPYQIRPIQAQYHSAVRVVTVMAPEQTGKSFCWRMPMVHKMCELPAPRWIIYESDEKAGEINEEQFAPLLGNAPGMAGVLNRHTALKQRYVLPNGSILDFGGAGAEITSKPTRDGVADELDTWPLTATGIRQNLRNFKKRFRTFWRRGEGCLVEVSSPSSRKSDSQSALTESIIGEEFDASDGGYWTMRCIKCRKLTMPSHATHLLQWELDATDDVVEASLTIECPACRFVHREANAVKMNSMGAYCNRDGVDLTKTWGVHVGCQWGALASPRVFRWIDIARAQMECGSTADMHAHAYFDNSWRGIPFKPRKAEAAGLKTIRKHCAPIPDPKILANLFFAADTQDLGWYWVVRAVDATGNLYRLANGFVSTPQELRAAWNTKHLGILPVMGIIDEGGHGDMPKHARELIMAERGLYGYKGGAFGERWRIGKTPRQILASAKQYKADLLYYIYSQTDQTNNYWFLPPENEIGDEYLEHICAYAPNNRMKHGDKYENWDTPASNTPDHYFDCEKQVLCILDVAYAELRADNWRLPVAGMRRGTTKKREQRKAPSVDL